MENKNKPMFKERFLVFKTPEKGGSAGGQGLVEGQGSADSRKVEAPAGTEASAGIISKEGEVKRPPFDPKGERAKASAEFAEKLAENDAAVYEKAVKVLEATGLKREECEAILDDDTNPYVAMFLDFAERMGEEGWTLDSKATERGWIGLRLKGGIAGTPDFVNKMLLWKDVIYPRLTKTLGSFYNENLIRVMVLHDLYGIHKLLKNLEYSVVPSKGLVDWTKWEIGQLVNGISLEELVKMEKEMLAGRKAEAKVEVLSEEDALKKLNGGEDLPEVELPSKVEISDDVDEAMRQMLEEKERVSEAKREFFPDEMAKIDSLVERVPDPKDIDPDDYEGFVAESSQIVDDLAGKSPAVAGLKGRVEDALQEYETLVAGGYSSEEAVEALSDSGLDSDLEKAFVDAEAAGDDETVAALGVYKDVVKTKVHVLNGYYKPGD